MNDYWNDPPEDRTPYCPDCGIPYDITQDKDDKNKFNLKCGECGKTETVIQKDEMPEDDLKYEDWAEPMPIPAKCPHGQPWAECNACMIESDRQYDASRGA